MEAEIKFHLRRRVTCQPALLSGQTTRPVARRKILSTVLTGQLQPLINDGFIVELCNTIPRNRYRRLYPTATARPKGIIDIENSRRGKNLTSWNVETNTMHPRTD